MKRINAVTLFCAVAALTACHTPEQAIRKCLAEDKGATAEQKAAVWISIADLKKNQKNYDDAVEAYQKSLSLHRSGTGAQDALNQCGLVLSQLKDYAGAIECFKQVAEIPNTDKKQSRVKVMTSLQNMADVYIVMKQYGNAVKVWEAAAKKPEFQDEENRTVIGKKIIDIYCTQVAENIRLKRLDEAQKGLDILKKITKDERIANLDVYLHLGRAAVAARNRNYKSAQAYYLAAVNIPGSKRKITASCELILFYLHNNKKAEAEKALKELLTLPCTNPDEQYQVSFVRYRYLNLTKKYQEAITLLDNTAKIKGLRPPRVANCYGLISLIYYQAFADIDKSTEYYKKAIGVPGGNWQKPYLKRKLGM